MSSSDGMRDASAMARVFREVMSRPVREPKDRKSDDTQHPWAAWPMSILDRLPVPYWIVVLVAGASAVGEQVIELMLSDPSLERIGSLASVGLVFPILVIYILTHLRILKNAAIHALSDLRPSVHVSDDVYEAYARRLVQANPWVEVVLLTAALGVVLVLFLGMRTELLAFSGGLPSSPVVALFVILNYTLLGWLILSLVYCSLRQAAALRGLAHLPLEVNVFDPANLLPFGRLGLIQSLPTVALILVPLIFLGPPTHAGWLVYFLSIVSILSLFVPLWGVHQQIDRAKEEALDNIYRRLLAIQETLLSDDDLDSQTIDTMADRTAMLTKLRDLIRQSPNWPFKDSAAVARAIAAVSSPLVYFLLNELLGAYIVPLMTGGTP